MLASETQIFTPYGATESLPVSSIGSHEILRDLRPLTDAGRGVCVGKPAPNIRVRIIRITDTPIAAWSEDLELPVGQIGEIAVQGPVVTAEYFQRPDATALAKIQDGGSVYHRMGDCGYFDAQGRLWFVGRKSQRVRLATGDLFSIPVEAVFNTHPKVARSALVGVVSKGVLTPVIIIEPNTHDLGGAWDQEIRALAQKHPHTRGIERHLIHLRLPVDIRHNSKINREALTRWAQGRLG